MLDFPVKRKARRHQGKEAGGTSHDAPHVHDLGSPRLLIGVANDRTAVGVSVIETLVEIDTRGHRAVARMTGR